MPDACRPSTDWFGFIARARSLMFRTCPPAPWTTNNGVRPAPCFTATSDRDAGGVAATRGPVPAHVADPGDRPAAMRSRSSTASSAIVGASNSVASGRSTPNVSRIRRNSWTADSEWPPRSKKSSRESTSSSSRTTRHIAARSPSRPSAGTGSDEGAPPSSEPGRSAPAPSSRSPERLALARRRSSHGSNGTAEAMICPSRSVARMRSSASTPSAVVIPRRSAASAGDSACRRGLAPGTAAAAGRSLAAPCQVMSDRWPTNRCARTRSASTPTSRHALQLMLRVRPGTRRLRARASRSRAMVAAVYSTWPGRPSNALTDEKSTNSSGGAAANGASEKSSSSTSADLKLASRTGVSSEPSRKAMICCCRVPAAWKTPWMAPKRARTSASARRIASRLPTSATSVSTSAPRVRRRSTASAPSSPFSNPSGARAGEGASDEGSAPMKASLTGPFAARCSAMLSAMPLRSPVMTYVPPARTHSCGSAGGSRTGS